MAVPSTITWDDGSVLMIDQRRLPGELVFARARSVHELCDLINTLAVRGAPALGIAGALGVALAVARGTDAELAAEQLIATRPTAVNLAHGVRRALSAADPLAEARAMIDADRERNEAIGRNGASVLGTHSQLITHCNAGALACGSHGTAIGVIACAFEQGLVEHVWVDETRPVLQGARLTTWELERLGIPHSLIVDAAAGGLLAREPIDAVIVGADRVARNGDVVNKVGTYPLAVLADRHDVAFFVAFPASTFDADTETGEQVVIEQRPPDEVTTVQGIAVAPEGTEVWNPAFDVTPAELVAGYVTELGVLGADALGRLGPQ